MPAPYHPDEQRIKLALRQMFLAEDGKLPSLPSLKALFENPLVSAATSSGLYDSVLVERDIVSLAVLRRCRKAVVSEFRRGRNIIDSRILVSESEPLLQDCDVWPRQSADQRDPAGYLDDERSELILLNTICRGVFGFNLPRISAEASQRLPKSLSGLEPAAKTFLLVEYAVRNSIRRRLQRTPELAYGGSVEELSGTRDIDFLLAMKPWQWSQNLVVPYEYMASLDWAPQLKTWVILLEPLCLPSWAKVREWYLMAIYNNASQLEVISKHMSLQISPGNSLPVTWQTILQLAAGWHGSKR